MLRAGGEALADAELLAVLLDTGPAHEPALERAQEILATIGGLAGLVDAHHHFRHRPGIGAGEAATLLAAREIACRLAKEAILDCELLDRPEAVAGYLSLRYGRSEQEVMGVLFLDVRNRLVGEMEVFRGTLHRLAVEPRAILKSALMCGAWGFVLFHSHPSGDPAPSPEDLEFTRRVAEAADLVGIRLLDHVIFATNGSFVSLQRRGAW
ncbi:MAG: DNA repair protein RadC [Thermoanaerobaculia bacterium]|nr:DNA repair protein RadC [Thermoanaerobaculia bacterium]